eukprot:Gregarina_sp_Poly_1__5836@NODE_3073_length_1406_cov_43_018671_g1947_i0_p3_GENE_NODE_3073_length_1406_cov_43_018671_g1947_i0NODE_3073_length_1406_cov_43_018671_g1947_i0_p3_ORF_typecomplete_len113_score16_98DUF2970/PF11174_8/0_016DUF2970/PF11174_8/1_2e03LapA_dom/PF06305_11/0_008DUF4834/PF16118_5/0_012CYYR1/PF10873_8/0_011Shisa/PF13908_6/0_013Myelin_PLP/PF01275_19/0_015Tmemb_170/PF10190_9/0_019PAP_PilO/PF06864_12/0_017DUF5381/PF17353_2/0_021DUF5129/PF17173_4/0_021DUF3824/PF12868_7/0_054SieB/PF14163
MGNATSQIASYNQQRLQTMTYVLVGVIGAVFLGGIIAWIVSAVSKAHTEKMENKARMEAERHRTNHQADMLMLEVLHQNQQNQPPPQHPPPVVVSPQPVILSPTTVAYYPQG